MLFGRKISKLSCYMPELLCPLAYLWTQGWTEQLRMAGSCGLDPRAGIRGQDPVLGQLCY